MRSSLKFAGVWLAIVCSIGAGASYFLDISFWTAALIVGVALIANGLFAEWEDRQPGGFYNPKDKDQA
jgi:hypothetical protein